ncbi:MAG: hypothetical protein ACK5JT_15485 [Hyphomicrobiaceae bacterium]
MLSRLLQLCIVIVATMVMVGEGLACSHHAERSGSADAHSTDVQAKHVTRQGDALAASGSGMAHRNHVAGRHTLAAHDNPLPRVPLLGRHECCSGAQCVHSSMCAGDCCALSQSVLLVGHRAEERKLAPLVPRWPGPSFVALVKAAQIDDDAGDRRRWRDAVALRSTFVDPRQACVVRLTI